MRKSIILAIMLAIVLVAVPAFASVQNVKVSGAVDSTYLFRQNFDFGNGQQSREEQNLFITQTTLQVDADLTDQVSVTIGLINERHWESDTRDSDGSQDSESNASDVQLYLAYVTLREMLYSPLTLVVGRQDFRYGNSFIMDSAGPNNAAYADSGISAVAQDLTKSTTLDAIRAILDYNPLTIDLVFAVISEDAGGSLTADNIADDNYLYGINANYQLGDDMDSVVEAYFWKKSDKSPSTAGAGAKADTIIVKGMRGSTNPIEGLNIQAEAAFQTGTKAAITGTTDNRRRKALGLQAIVNYQIPWEETAEYNPTAQYVFTKVTGDRHGGSGTSRDFRAWEPFFENQAGGKIYNAIFNLTNIIIHSVSISANPMEDVLAKVSFASLWLEDPATGSCVGPAYASSSPTGCFTQPDGGAETLATKENKKHLGKELDFELWYDYTEDVQIGLNTGIFWPGSVFDPSSENNDNSHPAKQVLVHLNVAF